MTTSLPPTDSELLAYLDELLPVNRSAMIERLLRDQPELRQRTASLLQAREQGAHTVGEIWRRSRLSCLSRVQLGSYLLEVSPATLKEYIDFHLQVIECRYCQANLEDLKALQQANTMNEQQQQRQRRYFESSAGMLHSHEMTEPSSGRRRQSQGRTDPHAKR